MARLGAKKIGPGQIAFGVALLALAGAGVYLAFRPSSAPPAIPESPATATTTGTPSPDLTPAPDTSGGSDSGSNTPSANGTGTPIPPEVAALQTPLPEATPTPLPTTATTPQTATAGTSPLPTAQPTGVVPRVEGAITNATAAPLAPRTGATTPVVNATPALAMTSAPIRPSAPAPTPIPTEAAVIRGF